MGGGTLATCIAPRAFSQRMNLLRRENTVHSKTMGAGWEVGPFKPPSIGDTEGCVQSRYASLHSIKNDVICFCVEENKSCASESKITCVGTTEKMRCLWASHMGK